MPISGTGAGFFPAFASHQRTGPIMATTYLETFTKVPTTATAEIDGQLVALDIQAGICFGLDPVATHIWKLLDAYPTADRLCAALLELYDVDPATCEEQTLSLLHELADIGLISRA
ncbi:SynChlorMet cassette protein ScmD [Novosphingobium resinovorum]|uniref:SynChlorMet cassette protein ScmD n=2 Tax=Novosphingobium resinovorum TaxID=158500 RepID=A0A031JXQ0_9SPHN|nr:SynChlorMet cassette protein ScmD [Novosphingobium resinovorum]